MKKNKTLIDKPIINYISKEELDAIVPMMSGGSYSGGGSVSVAYVAPKVQLSVNSMTSFGKTMKRYVALNSRLKCFAETDADGFLYVFAVSASCKSVDGNGNPAGDLPYSHLCVEILNRGNFSGFAGNDNDTKQWTVCYPSVVSSSVIGKKIDKVFSALLKDAVGCFSKIGNFVVLTLDMIDAAGVFSKLDIDAAGNVYSDYYQKRVFKFKEKSNISEMHHQSKFGIYVSDSNVPLDFRLTYYVPSTIPDLVVAEFQDYRLYNKKLFMKSN